jgi:hypothetical protein
MPVGNILAPENDFASLMVSDPPPSTQYGQPSTPNGPCGTLIAACAKYETLGENEMNLEMRERNGGARFNN